MAVWKQFGCEGFAFARQLSGWSEQPDRRLASSRRGFQAACVKEKAAECRFYFLF
jgi:hypothetical protein